MVEKKKAPKKKPAKKTKKSKTDSFGRPTVITSEVLAKLEYAFSLGSTDVEACVLANIDPATLYRYQKKKPDFCERKEQLKETPTLKARKTIIDGLGDPVNARWYLERKVPDEFNPSVKNEHSGPKGAPLPPIDVTINVVESKNKS